MWPVLLAAAMLVAASPAAHAVGPPPSVRPSLLSGVTDADTRSALELRTTIDDVEAGQVSIDSRIAVTSRSIAEQSSALDRADAELEAAQSAFHDRVIEMYKSAGSDMFAILLDARSFTDLMNRWTVITQVVEADRRAVEELAIVSSQAQYQAAALEGLRQHDESLRALKEESSRVLTTLLTEEQTLLTSLTPENRAVADSKLDALLAWKEEWRASSLPTGTVAAYAQARVRPYGSRSYLRASHHPARFRSAGDKERVSCSWYGSAFAGMPTASGQTFNPSDFTCAHPTLPFGTWIALSRYDGVAKRNRRIIAVVNDRGPFVEGRGLELSAAAADALGVADLGVSEADMEIVRPIGD